MSQVRVGIDVSKAWLDVNIRPEDKVLRLPNTLAGVQEITHLSEASEVGRIILEATGGMELTAGLALYEAGFPVVIQQIPSKSATSKSNKTKHQSTSRILF